MGGQGVTWGTGTDAIGFGIRTIRYFHAFMLTLSVGPCIGRAAQPAPSRGEEGGGEAVHTVTQSGPEGPIGSRLAIHWIRGHQIGVYAGDRQLVWGRGGGGVMTDNVGFDATTSARELSLSFSPRPQKVLQQFMPAPHPKASTCPKRGMAHAI